MTILQLYLIGWRVREETPDAFIVWRVQRDRPPPCGQVFETEDAAWSAIQKETSNQ